MPDSHLQVPLVTERLPPLLGTDRTFTSTHTGTVVCTVVFPMSSTTFAKVILRGPFLADALLLDSVWNACCLGLLFLLLGFVKSAFLLGEKL